MKDAALLLVGFVLGVALMARHPGALRGLGARVRVGPAGVVSGVALVLACMAVGLFVGPLLDGTAAVKEAGRAALEAVPGVSDEKSDTPRPTDARRRVGRDQSVVARARGRSIRVYARRGAKKPTRRLGVRRIEGVRVPLVFLVRKRGKRWLQVLLPSRPNLSKGWIRARDVRLSATVYKVRVRLRAHRLTVWRAGKVILRKPIGTGRAVSPTPTGRYYITDLIKARDPKGLYGPYSFGLSGHSPVYTSFRGGNGQLGLHGTNAPADLGTDVSAGCIRVGNGAIRALAKILPLGTPVTIER